MSSSKADRDAVAFRTIGRGGSCVAREILLQVNIPRFGRFVWNRQGR
jgi:hypothetical protein